MSQRKRKFQFIINPSAGRGRPERITEAIKRSFSNTGIKYDYKVLEYKGEAADIARKSVGSHDVIVAAGGDGTVNEVLNAIVGSEATFGILPVGTGNGFARAIGLPLNPEKACRVLIEGHTRELDVGKANDRYFLGTAGIGYDAVISRMAGERFKKLRGMWLYFFAGILTFREYEPQQVKVEMDSAVIEITPLVIAIANTKRYGGSALIAPDAKPNDGLLDVCIARYMTAAQVLWHLPKLFTGKHVRLDGVEMRRGKYVTISALNPIPIHVDGEAIDSRSSVQFTVKHKAIRIIVPEKFEP